MASNQLRVNRRAIIIYVGATCWFRPFAFDCNMEKQNFWR